MIRHIMVKNIFSILYNKKRDTDMTMLRGCSQMISAKRWEADPPTLLCQKRQKPANTPAPFVRDKQILTTITTTHVTREGHFVPFPGNYQLFSDANNNIVKTIKCQSRYFPFNFDPSFHLHTFSQFRQSCEKYNTKISYNFCNLSYTPCV